MTATPTKATAIDDAPKQRVVIVTGLSGAGKSSALKALEDMGYEAVDNLPLSLLGAVVTPRDGRAPDGEPKPLVIGVDIRTRDFAVESFLDGLDKLMGRDEISVRLLFLDSSDEMLRRRYTETRRRHPLAGDRPVSDGIQHERRLLAGLRDRADDTIDTSELSPGELRQILKDHYALDAPAGLTIFVTSFSYRHGLPREADLVFDVRFLRNPHYETDLRPLSGLDAVVGAFIAADSGCAGFIRDVTGLLGNLLPRFEQEGKSDLTIALGCTGGRHRSVYMAEQLAEWLRDQGLAVGVNHRDMGP